jgi:HlyD family secretion protein
MKPQDRTEYDDGSYDDAADDDAAELRLIDEPREQAAGPQGRALILELQRLRQAFDQDDPQVQPTRSRDRVRPSRDRVHSGGSKRQRQPKRRGTIGRAIDVCLEQFGLNAPAPVAPSGVRRRDPDIDLPPRQPRIAGPDPRPREMVRPGREPARPGNSRPPASVNSPPATVKRQSPVAAPPRANLPARVTRRPPESTFGQLIGMGRNSLVAGATFLVSRDALADNDNLPGESLSSRTGRAYQNELRTGLRVLIIVTVLGGGWLTLVPLAGAVVVPGSLVVQSNVKTIQHPTGGIVAEIPVQNGMRVKAGDLLLRLDATQAQASLDTVSKQLDDARARIARLSAERDGLDRFETPAKFSARLNEDSIKSLLASEDSLFKARSSARQSQRELLQNRVLQLGEEIKGHESQIESKGKELELITSELAGVQELYDKRLVPLTRLTTLQRDRARIEGERGQLMSAIAETKSKIGEAQLQIVKLDQDFRTDVVKELGETEAKKAELVQKAVSAQDVIDRIEIRAPTSGLVHQLSAHTIGGVIKGSDTIMEIVPDSDDLQVEAKLDPKDIDQVRIGQKAFVRFSAFNARVTPQVTGEVSFVSADTSQDTRSPQSFYTVRVTLSEEERHRLAGDQLVSGMPAEVFMQTGSRTMLSYLFKPIMEQLGRAFVER